MTDVKIFPRGPKWYDNYDSIFGKVKIIVSDEIPKDKILFLTEKDMEKARQETQDTWERPNGGRSYVSRGGVSNAPVGSRDDEGTNE